MQPDGTQVMVRVFGDEFFGYSKDLHGYVVDRGKDGYVYYANFGEGKLSLTTVRAATVPGSIVRGAVRSVPVSLMMQGASARRESNLRYMNLPVKSSAAGSGFIAGDRPSEIRTLVLLVQFKDIKFSGPDPGQSFDRLLNLKGYAENGATGSVADYFNDNFAGTASFRFDVQGVYTLPENADYYGAQDGSSVDIRPGEMVAQACRLASEAGVDFSVYDYDGDGKTDRIVIIFAGYNQAEGGPSYTIWPHHSNIENKNMVLNGVKIASYACASELRGASGTQMAGIGTFCHEFAHFFGLPDFYDINGEEEGTTAGLCGFLSLMDEGNFLNEGRTPPYLNAVERELLGLTVPEEAESGKRYILESVSKNRILRMETSRTGEYFLVECRTRAGWDSYIGGEGMIVYHLDKSDRIVGGLPASERWKYNIINSYGGHPCATVLSAGGNAAPVPSVFFPGTSFNTELSYTSAPAMADWDGNATGMKITGIGYGEGKVGFRIENDLIYDATLPAITGYTRIPYQREIRVSWMPAFPFPDGCWEVSWGESPETETGTGTYSETVETRETEWLIENLEPGRDYTVRIRAVQQESMGPPFIITCTTDPVSSEYPFMYIKGYYPDGESLDLIIYNLPADCTEIIWKVNGEPLSGTRWKFAGAGEYEISAELYYEDGSCDVITKTVTVR